LEVFGFITCNVGQSVYVKLTEVRFGSQEQFRGDIGPDVAGSIVVAPAIVMGTVAGIAGPDAVRSVIGVIAESPAGEDMGQFEAGEIPMEGGHILRDSTEGTASLSCLAAVQSVEFMRFH